MKTNEIGIKRQNKRQNFRGYMKGKKHRFIDEDKRFILVIVLIIIVLGILTIQVKAMMNDNGEFDRKLCPYTVEGNKSASLKIKYFDSPYCFYCWLEKPILKRSLEAKGTLYNIEKYDIRYCLAEKKRYNMPGTPGWVFISEKKEFPTYGFIEEERLNSIICELSGGC